MRVFWAELVVGSDDGGGGGPHRGLGGGAGQVLQVAEADEEDKGVDGEENDHSTTAKKAWHEWYKHFLNEVSTQKKKLEAVARSVTRFIISSKSHITLFAGESGSAVFCIKSSPVVLGRKDKKHLCVLSQGRLWKGFDQLCGGSGD